MLTGYTSKLHDSATSDNTTTALQVVLPKQFPIALLVTSLLYYV